MRRQHTAGDGFKLCLLIALAQAVALAAEADNINWGPFRLTAGLTGGFEYDDNVNTSQNDPKSDFFVLMGPFVNGTVTLVAETVDSSTATVREPEFSRALCDARLKFTYAMSLSVMLAVTLGIAIPL